MEISQAQQILLISIFQKTKNNFLNDDSGFILNWAAMEKLTRNVACIIKENYNTKQRECFENQYIKKEIENMIAPGKAIGDKKIIKIFSFLFDGMEVSLENKIKELYKMRNTSAHAANFPKNKNIIRIYDEIITSFFIDIQTKVKII